MPVRKGHGEWRGDLMKGGGTLGTQTGTLAGLPYSFSSRFESGKGTNPEELLAAAHAACYSMDLSARLSAKGYAVDSIRTEDSVHVEKQGGGFTITLIEIAVQASVSGIDEKTFHAIAEETKAGCPVSRALAGPRMTLTATLKK